MVVVTNEPYTETEPMLQGAPTDPENTAGRRQSYAEAYRNITSSMKADQLSIDDPNLACKLLKTAVELQNMPLTKQCIEILDEKLDKTNCLMIYSQLSQLKMPSLNPNNFEPSAPPIVDNENQRDKDWVRELTEHLRHNCLLEIDKAGDYVLRQDEILDLSYSDLLAIVKRDTLQVKSESLVYAAVHKWVITECHRRTLQPHQVNIKAVVRELRYAPRYGLMTRKEFCSKIVHGETGPTRSYILEEVEWRLIRFYLGEISKNRPVAPLPHGLSVPRCVGSEKPKILSSQSSVRARDSRPADSQCERNRYWDRFFLNFCLCWSAIFD